MNEIVEFESSRCPSVKMDRIGVLQTIMYERQFVAETVYISGYY